MDLKRLVELADKARDEISLCFIGMPGIGKSTAIWEFAAENERHCTQMILSGMQPNEISGLAMPDAETKEMTVFDNIKLTSLQPGDILFFDELLNAPEATLKAAQTLIQERKMLSDHDLPDVLICAATNPLASPKRISSAIKQRFIFVPCYFDEDEWSIWVEEHIGIKPTSRMIKTAKNICSEGLVKANEYNEVTPRTLTKLLYWMSKLDDEEVKELAGFLAGSVYPDSIIDEVLEARMKRERSKEAILLDIFNIAQECMPATEYTHMMQEFNGNWGENVDEWDECTILRTLQESISWDNIAAKLQRTEA